MKNAAITTTLFSSLLIACSDGVIVGNSGLQSDNITPAVGLQTPFTPVDNGTTNNTQANDVAANNATTDDSQANDAAANNTTDNGTENINFYGLVSVTENITDNHVTAFSTFIQLPNSLPIAQLTAELAPTQDVCTTANSSQILDDAGMEATSASAREVLTVTAANGTSVSAGEVLTVISANGTYMELIRQEIQEGFIVYNPQPNTVAGILPTNLSIDIPGDVFPAFANVAAATVQTLNVTTPNAGEHVTPTTAFSWNASNTAGNIISISATSFINAEAMTVTCSAVDDGEFTFPAATQNEMGNEFTSIASSISRDAFVVRQYDDATILVTTSSKAR